MFNLELKPISEAPRGHWVPTATFPRWTPDWILVFGGKSSKIGVHVTMSHWVPEQERWIGFPKDSPPKWFVDMRPFSPFLE